MSLIVEDGSGLPELERVQPQQIVVDHDHVG